MKKLMANQSPKQLDKMREYVEAKGFRELLNIKKVGKTLVQDEETLDRKGKKRLVPQQIAEYQQKLIELSKMKNPGHLIIKSPEQNSSKIEETEEDPTKESQKDEIKKSLPQIYIEEQKSLKAKSQRSKVFDKFSSKKSITRNTDDSYSTSYNQNYFDQNPRILEIK